jgi:hypothetical protein
MKAGAYGYCYQHSAFTFVPTLILEFTLDLPFLIRPLIRSKFFLWDRSQRKSEHGELLHLMSTEVDECTQLTSKIVTMEGIREH